LLLVTFEIRDDGNAVYADLKRGVLADVACAVERRDLFVAARAGRVVRASLRSAFVAS
jgi:hypothetical protein